MDATTPHLLRSIGHLVVIVVMAAGCSGTNETVGEASADLPVNDGAGDTLKGDLAANDANTALEKLLRGCAISASCGGSWSVQSCLDEAFSEYGTRSEISCLAATKGCAGTRECLGSWSEACPDGSSSEPSCIDDHTYVRCDAGIGRYVDCRAKYGASCESEYVYGGGGYSVASCVSDNPCGEDWEYPKCWNNNVVICDEFHLDGEQISATCESGQGCDHGRCVGPGAVCSRSTCDGTIGHFCVGGRTQEIDCAAFGPGFTCEETGCTQGSECTVSDPTIGTCSGDELVVCVAGKIARVDCAALGFKRCGRPPTLGAHEQCLRE